jgi:predicted DCC family thiol-disulfide oxidoreductase YuxK
VTGAPRGTDEGCGFERLVLFDGVCVLCNDSVRWLMQRDRRGRLRFAPLQGQVGRALRRRHPRLPCGVETMVYVDASGGEERVYLGSEAVFRVLREIEGAPRWLLACARLPRWQTDLGYRLIARMRYRVFGRLDACRVPSPEERARILP